MAPTMRVGLGGAGSEGSSVDRDSLEDYSAEEMLVLATESIQELNIEEEPEEEEVGKETKSLIVTNVDLTVFTEAEAKSQFEAKFLTYDPNLVFYYIRTFRRVRVDFPTHGTAALARSVSSLLLLLHLLHTQDRARRLSVRGPDRPLLLAADGGAEGGRGSPPGAASPRETVAHIAALLAAGGLGTTQVWLVWLLILLLLLLPGRTGRWWTTTCWPPWHSSAPGITTSCSPASVSPSTARSWPRPLSWCMSARAAWWAH